MDLCNKQTSSNQPQLTGLLPSDPMSRTKIKAVVRLSRDLHFGNKNSRKEFQLAAIRGGKDTFSDSELECGRVQKLHGIRAFKLLRPTETKSGQSVWRFPVLSNDNINEAWNERETWAKKDFPQQAPTKLTLGEWDAKKFEAFLCIIGNYWSRAAAMNSSGAVINTREGCVIKIELRNSDLSITTIPGTSGIKPQEMHTVLSSLLTALFKDLPQHYQTA